MNRLHPFSGLTVLLLCVLIGSLIRYGIAPHFRNQRPGRPPLQDAPYVKMEPAASRLRPGDAAPDFTIQGEAGRPVQLSDYRGRWVVLVFLRNRT